MRKPEHLSPTSLGIFIKNPQEYYLTYLSDNRPPREPQTQPMAAGSAFDAYVKSYLYERLFGKNDPKFELDAIFTAQVVPHNRDWGRPVGLHLFELYKRSGALGNLMLDLQKSISEPRFELEVKGTINGYREGVTKNMLGVPFLGKPDIFYINSQGAHVIFDWKVSGYCADRTTTPLKGYVRLHDGSVNKGQHKEAQLININGILVNVAQSLDELHEDWARQLSIYGWLCGEDIGGDFIVAIDQLACKAVPDSRPAIRVAEHRSRVRSEFQWNVYSQAQYAWELINSDHFFRDVSKEDSEARCRLLDGFKEALEGDGSVNDNWFSSVTRGA